MQGQNVAHLSLFLSISVSIPVCLFYLSVCCMILLISCFIFLSVFSFVLSVCCFTSLSAFFLSHCYICLFVSFFLSVGSFSSLTVYFLSLSGCFISLFPGLYLHISVCLFYLSKCFFFLSVRLFFSTFLCLSSIKTGRCVSFSHRPSLCFSSCGKLMNRFHLSFPPANEILICFITETYCRLGCKS